MSRVRARPRVLTVITEMCIGGASFTALETARALRDDFSFSFVCGRPRDPTVILEEAASEFPLQQLATLVRPIKPLTDARAVHDIRKLILEAAPAIVHTHSSKAGIVGRAAARGTGAATVHSIHGWAHSPDDPRARRLAFVHAERIVARWSDVLVAASADVRDEGLALGIGRPSQYEVVPGFVDFTPVYPDWHSGRCQARKALELQEDAVVIGWVGRFESDKDPVSLVEILARTLRRFPEGWAVLVGDGSRRAEVEAGLSAAGVLDRVVFTGMRSDARYLYAAFDVVLHTSKREGHPRVPQEAIAERVPVVMAATSGTREILFDERAGTAICPGNADGFVAALTRIFDGVGPRAPLPNEVVTAVASNNGIKVSASRQRTIYESVTSV